MAVDIEGVEVRGTGDALRGHGLDDVAAGDVLFHGCDVAFVALAADVGGVLLVELDGVLGWEGDAGLFEGV